MMNEKSGAELSINVPKQELGDFLMSLLDRKQTLEFNLFRSFRLRYQDIENIFLLLDQRISEQNENKLISFSVKYIYSNGSSVDLESYDKFKSFTEVKPVVCTKCILSLTYLVKFNNSESPEKQTVEVAFSTNAKDDDMPFLIMDKSGRVRPKYLFEGKGMIKIRIEHSSLSWGSDIENMLKNKIESMTEDRNTYIEFMLEKEAYIDAIVYALQFFLFFTVSIIILKNIDFSTLLKIVSLSQSIENKVMISFVIILTFQHYFFLIINQIYSIMYNCFFDFYEKDSFICVTDESVKHMKIEMNKKKRTLYIGLSFLIINIFVSVVANIIAAFIAFGST